MSTVAAAVAAPLQAQPSPGPASPAVARAHEPFVNRYAIAILLALTMAGAFLRFTWIDRPAMWNDEAHVFRRVTGSFQDLLDLLQNDGFGPLHYEAYWALGHWKPPTMGRLADGIRHGDLGYEDFFSGNPASLTPFWMRLIPSLAGTLMVPAMYFLARQLCSRRTSLLVAAFTACSAYMMAYSHDSKMYMHLWLFCALNIGCLMWWLRTGLRIAWLCWIAAGIAMAGTHAPGLVLLGIQPLILLTARKHHWKKLVLFVLGTAMVSSAPIMHYFHFGRFTDRVDENWSAAGLGWLPGVLAGRDGPNMAMFVTSAYMYSWEWPRPSYDDMSEPPPPKATKEGATAVEVAEYDRLRKAYMASAYGGMLSGFHIDHRVLTALMAAVVIVLGMAAAGALPWPARWRGELPQDVPTEPWWRSSLWLAVWIVVPAYAFYHASVKQPAAPEEWHKSVHGLVQTVYADRAEANLKDRAGSVPKARAGASSKAPAGSDSTVPARTGAKIREVLAPHWWRIIASALGCAALTMVWPRVGQWLRRQWPEVSRWVLGGPAFGLGFLVGAVVGGRFAGDLSMTRGHGALLGGFVLGLLSFAGLWKPRIARIAILNIAGLALLYLLAQSFLDQVAVPMWKGTAGASRYTWYQVPRQMGHQWEDFLADRRTQYAGLFILAPLAFLFCGKTFWSRAMRLGQFALVVGAVYGLCSLVHWYLDKYPPGNDGPVWMPRYLGVIWPAFAIGLCALIMRLPSHTLRWAAIAILLSANLAQAWGRMFAGSEPRLDLIMRDICAADDANSRVRTYVEEGAETAHPAGGIPENRPGKYYVCIETGNAFKPKEFLGAATVSDLKLKMIRKYAGGAELAAELRPASSVMKVIVWDRVLAMPDEGKDDILEAIRGDWKKVRQEFYPVRYHWNWSCIYIARRREYVREQALLAAPAAAQPALP